MSELLKNLSLSQILLIILSGMFLANYYLRRANAQLRVEVMKLRHGDELNPLLSEKAKADARLNEVQEEFDASLRNYRSKYPVDPGSDPNGGSGGPGK